MGMLMTFDNLKMLNPNLMVLNNSLAPNEQRRLQRYLINYNFYEGYHWEDVKQSDKPQITQNWCRRFVDKFVSAEFNSGIRYKFDSEVEESILPFTSSVWEDNNEGELLTSVGQMKSVTGDGYIGIFFEDKNTPGFDDPFGLYPNGRIRLYSIPATICYPEYGDGYDTDNMISCQVLYPIQLDNGSFMIRRYVYYKDKIELYNNDRLTTSMENKYGIIPIVHFRNLVVSGRHFGASDLDDLIPLNTELNAKISDISEILDYHSAPITIVKGARISQLEKGANKIWGGLPKESDVFNLELNSDLGASDNYIQGIKNSMREIKGMPALALGGNDLPTNLSGVALQIAFMPLIDTIKMKQNITKARLELVNRIALKIAFDEKLLDKPDSSAQKIFNHSATFGDILPKDLQQELESLQSELKMGLETREGAAIRLKKENVEELLKKVEEEKEENPQFYGKTPMVLSPGQKLVDPETGEVIAENEVEMEGEVSEKKGIASKKVTGKNKEGKELKIISGNGNFNDED